MKTLHPCPAATLRASFFIIASFVSGCATLGVLSDLDNSVAKLVEDKKTQLSRGDFKEFLDDFYDSAGRLAKVEMVKLPASVPESHASSRPTVKGDPMVTMATGETFRYTGRAVFMVLSRRGLPETFLVDVRADEPDYISGVWHRGTRGTWHHFQVPETETLLEVPLMADERFKSESVDAKTLEAFGSASVFLSFEGGVVPGPTWEEAEAIMSGNIAVVDGDNIEKEIVANVITFRAAYANFRDEGFRTTDDLARAGKLLLVRFLNIARLTAPTVDDTNTQRQP